MKAGKQKDIKESKSRTSWSFNGKHFFKFCVLLGTTEKNMLYVHKKNESEVSNL